MEFNTPDEPSGFAKRLAENFRLYHDSNIPKLNLKLARQSWELIVLFWKRPGAWVSYLVMALYLVYTFGTALIGARLAKFVGDQLDALAKHDASAFYRVLVLSLVTQFGLSIVSVIATLPYSVLLLRWRQWLTERFLDDYLQNSNYYVLNRDRAIDNPDERLALTSLSSCSIRLSLRFPVYGRSHN